MWGQVKQWFIPCDAKKKNLNWFKVNSPPLSVCICLIEVEKNFFTIVLNLTKVANASDLSGKGYNHEYLEKSSMNKT